MRLWREVMGAVRVNMLGFFGSGGEIVKRCLEMIILEKFLSAPATVEFS